MFFKKKIVIVAFIFATISFVNAQSFIPKGPYRSIIGNVATVKQSVRHHTIMPFVSFDNFLFANTGGFGCDFKYSKPSGLTLYGNLGSMFGNYSTHQRDDYSYNSGRRRTVNVFAFLFSLEALIGYSKTFSQKHTIAFALGLQGAYGIGMMEFIAGAFRLEYSYLITHRYGIHFSFTDGIGLGVDNNDLTFINRAGLKAGPIIYF